MAILAPGIAQPNGDATGSARVYDSTQPTEEVQAAWDENFPDGVPAECRVRYQKNDRDEFELFVVDTFLEYLYTGIPLGNPPIFSSNDGIQSPYNPGVIVTQREYQLWSANSVKAHCDSIRKRHPWDVAQITQPIYMNDLLTYYSPFDIYRFGPQNLWNVVCTLWQHNRIKILDPQVQSWLTDSKNQLKLKKWSETDGPILDILLKKDYHKFKISAHPADKPVLSHILKYQRTILPLHKPQEERIEPDHISSTALTENSASRPVGEHVSGEHKIGSPPPPRLCEDSKPSSASGNQPSPCVVKNGCHNHPSQGSMQPDHRHVDRSSAVEELQRSVGEAKMNAATMEPVDNRTISRVVVVVVNGTSSQHHPASVVKSQHNCSADGPSHQASVNGGNQKASTPPVMNAEPPKHIEQSLASVDADYHAEPVAVAHPRTSPSPLPREDRLTCHDKIDGGDTLESPQQPGLTGSASSDPQQCGVMAAPNKMAEEAQTQHHISTAVNVQPAEEPGHTVPLRKHTPSDAHGTRPGAQMTNKTNRAMRLPSHPAPMLQTGSSKHRASSGHVELPVKQDFFDNRPGSSSYATYGHSMTYDCMNRPTGGGSVHHRHFSHYVDENGGFQTQLSNRFSAAVPSSYHQPDPDSLAVPTATTPTHDCETDPANFAAQFSRDGHSSRANYNNKSRRWNQNRRHHAGYSFQANRDQFHPQSTWETNTPQQWRRTEIAENHQGDPAFSNKRGSERSHRPEFGFKGKCQTERRQNMAQPPVRSGLPSPAGYLPNLHDAYGPPQNMVQYPMGYGMYPPSGYASMAHHTGGSQQTRPFHPGMQPKSYYRDPHWVRPYPQGGQAHPSVSYPAHIPTMPPQHSAQSSQNLPVHKQRPRTWNSNQNEKRETAGVHPEKPLDCNAQSKPPSEEALDNDELIEQAVMSSSSQDSQSSRASSLRVKVSLPTVSTLSINQTLAVAGGEKNTQPINVPVEQKGPPEKAVTKEVDSSQVQQSANQQPIKKPKSRRLAGTKARETTAVTKVTVTSTNPSGISMFTEEEIRSRRKASERIPIPLNPRQARKRAPSKDKINDAQRDKVDTVQAVSCQTGSRVSDPVQGTPEPSTIKVQSAGSRDMSPSLAQDNIPRDEDHHKMPLNNETKHGFNARQHNHTFQSSNGLAMDYVGNQESQILDCQTLNGIERGLGLPSSTTHAFQFPDNGRGTIRGRGTDERGTVLHEAFGQMRDKHTKKAWRKNKLSRSIDFKSQNQPIHEQKGNDEKGEVPGALGQVTESTYSRNADASVGGHGRHPSVPQNTLNAGLRDGKGDGPQNVNSSESNGGHGGSLKVQKRRRPQRKPQPFGAQGQLGDKEDGPTAKADLSSRTTDATPSIVKATEIAHGQTIKHGDADIRGGNESSASDPGAKEDATVKGAVITTAEVRHGGTNSNEILKGNGESTP